MDRCGYFIEAKGLNAGLKVDDVTEFPGLGVNDNLPDIDSSSNIDDNQNVELPICENKAINDDENCNIEGHLATEEN